MEDARKHSGFFLVIMEVVNFERGHATGLRFLFLAQQCYRCTVLHPGDVVQ